MTITERDLARMEVDIVRWDGLPCLTWRGIYRRRGVGTLKDGQTLVGPGP
jgi:hypothetical protein